MVQSQVRLRSGSTAGGQLRAVAPFDFRKSLDFVCGFAPTAAEQPDVLVVAKLWPPMMESLRGAFRVHDRIHQSDPTAFAAVAPRIRAISASGE